MVSLKILALAIVAPILVFVGVSWYLGSLPQLTQKALSFFEGAKQLFTPIINGWNSLPSSIRSVIMLGIPTLAATFFAWTKSRAMTKLQQTEQQAATQATQLTGELSQAQTSAVSALQENTKLKEELQVYKAGNSAVAEFKDLMVQKDAKIENLEAQVKQLITERNTIQREYDNKFKEKTEDPYIKKILQT